MARVSFPVPGQRQAIHPPARELIRQGVECPVERLQEMGLQGRQAEARHPMVAHPEVYPGLTAVPLVPLVPLEAFQYE